METNTSTATDIGQQAALDEAPELYSPWAAVSIASMLLSFSGCLAMIVLILAVSSWAGVAIFVLPVLSLIAVITGVVGLMQISRSDGRIGGRNAAIMGAVVGLGLTALQGSVVLGAVLPWFAIGNNLKPVMQDYAEASADGDWSALRAMLSAESESAVSDERLQEFWERAAPAGTSGAEVTFDLGLFVEARTAMAAAKTASTADSIHETMFPVRLEWSDGSNSLVYVIMDAESLQGDSVLIVDLLVVNSAGKAVVLLTDGPAKAIVEMVGWEIGE